MELLKERFFNQEFVSRLSEDVQKEYPRFDKKKFHSFIFTSDWKKKELKERMHHIADALHLSLPPDYSKAIAILSAVAVRHIKEKNTGFGDMCFSDFVERFGLDHIDVSLPALALFTQACSSEYAVRPFIINYPERMMKQMEKWSKHKNYHVRRLASEGCRPRLPWAVALPEFKKDPSPIIPILENLKNDESEYVRRSVANNLNDISKDHPKTVLSIARQWYGENTNVNAILKHALRTQLKKGNVEALKIFGFSAKTSAKITDLRVEPNDIMIGESVRFYFTVKAVKNETLRIEYWVNFVKSNGSASKKVFQITEDEFEKRTRKEFSRKHRFQDFTTRKHYPGKHMISIVVNGAEKATTVVHLRK
jgi:3-methyladenine DNA glycosylase AlkC